MGATLLLEFVTKQPPVIFILTGSHLLLGKEVH